MKTKGCQGWWLLHRRDGTRGIKNGTKRRENRLNYRIVYVVIYTTQGQKKAEKSQKWRPPGVVRVEKKKQKKTRVRGRWKYTVYAFEPGNIKYKMWKSPAKRIIASTKSQLNTYRLPHPQSYFQFKRDRRGRYLHVQISKWKFSAPYLFEIRLLVG